MFCIIGCSSSLPIYKSKSKNSGVWTLSRIVLWSKERRSNLEQIKAWVRINVISQEEKKGFDAFLILNNKGKGRIEALGPWRSPFFSIVFDPDFVYLYIYNESTLYLSSNKPGYIQKLTEAPLDFSLLFDSLVSNLPENISQCSGSFSNEGAFPLLCMDCEEQGGCLKASVLIKDFPVVEEMAWIREDKDENFLVKYFDLVIQDGYTLPKVVHFQWPEGQEWRISFISLKVNQPVPDDTFTADEAWFQGKVINLEDLDAY
ncbi:MAG: hypothetical protein ACMUIU_15320 [bacterium]